MYLQRKSVSFPLLLVERKVSEPSIQNWCSQSKPKMT